MTEAAGTLYDRQLRFAEEYLIDLNATRAAVRAGYSPKTAQAQSSRLLSNVMVAAHIAELKRQRSIRTSVTQDRVLLEIARIAFFNVGDLFGPEGKLRSVTAIDMGTTAGIGNLTLKRCARPDDSETITMSVRALNKLRALELLMRHLGALDENGHPPRSRRDIRT